MSTLTSSEEVLRGSEAAPPGTKPGRSTAELTSGTVLASSTVYNLIGQLAPVLIAVPVIPILVHRLGVSRFGLLALAWMLVGYFSLFDFGIGRALTKMVAELHGRAHPDDVAALIWTGLAVMLGAGLLGMVLTIVAAPVLTSRLLQIPPELHREALGAFYVLAVSIPVVIVTTGLRGVLEAHQRFGIVNALRIPLGVFGFLGPLAVVLYTPNLVLVVGTLLITRIIVGIAHVWGCARVVPEMRGPIAIRRELLRPLISYGGWVTVSSIISPLMVYADRFLIGAIISIAAVAYYSTPFDMVSKLLVVPIALAAVLFPAFSTTYASDQARCAMLFGRAVQYVFLLIYPIVLIMVALAPEGMRLWLGPEFAANSSTVLRLLAGGVLINSLALVPVAVIQGGGRPDMTAKFHMIELPLFVVGLWYGVHAYGIVGAATVWSLRVLLDAGLLFWMAARLVPAAAATLRRGAWLTAAAVASLYAITLIRPWQARAGIVLVVALGLMCATWTLIFDDRERRLVGHYWGAFSSFGSRLGRSAKSG